MQETLEDLTADLRQVAAGPTPHEHEGPQPSHRFELFHAANSICSQKVRVVLAHHGLGYASRQLDIFAGQTYLPSHVRLRMIGCDRLGMPLVTTHTGSTSASSGGCDPAVVPTLVDWQNRAVLVDSKRICLYLDETVPIDRRLRPPSRAAAIDAELETVDNLPNYQMLAGRPPGTDGRPSHLRGSDGIQFASSKVERCDRYMATFADDPALVRAYGAKRAKEAQAARSLFSGEAMRSVYASAEAACEALNQRLATGGEAWLFGPSVTMADLFWAVELLRMDNLGAGAIWADGKLPHVARFRSAAEHLPAIRSAVTLWPGALY